MVCFMGALFILSTTCDLLQVVANAGAFCCIYDTWSFIYSVLVEKRIRKEGGGSPISKHVLAQPRHANDFLSKHAIYLKLIQLHINTTIHRTLFGIYFMRILS